MQKITLSALIVLFSYLLSAQDVYWVSYKSEPNFSPASVKLTRSEGMSEAAYQQVIGGKFHPIIEEKFVIKTEDSTIYFDGDSYSDGQKYSSTKLKASKLCTIYDYKSDSVVKFLFTADFAFKSKIDIKHWVIEDTAENPIGGISVKVAHNESDAYWHLSPVLMDLNTEEFWILLCNRANIVTDRVRISSGGIHGTVVDVKVVLRLALEHGASALVLGHNHPSGGLTPSEEDKRLTSKLTEAARLMDIRILDHLIIAGNSYFSFLEADLL